MVIFEERGKPEKNLSEKRENQQQTKPTYGVDAIIGTQTTLVGGECSHHCAIPCSPCGLSQGACNRPDTCILDVQNFLLIDMLF